MAPAGKVVPFELELLSIHAGACTRLRLVRRSLLIAVVVVLVSAAVKVSIPGGVAEPVRGCGAI